jgi:hypothetical protein
MRIIRLFESVLAFKPPRRQRRRLSCGRLMRVDWVVLTASTSAGDIFCAYSKTHQT